MTAEDSRLARLFDYTKFHIGIYIAAGTSMITILGGKDKSDFLKELIKHPWILLFSVVAMAAAGMAGGIIAGTCATASEFDKVWHHKIGPWDREWLKGSQWATIEHLAFWASVVSFALAATLPRF